MRPRIMILFALAFWLTCPASSRADDEAYLGVAIKAGPEGVGVQIITVQADSPAAKAELKELDVILKLDDADVSGLQGFVDAIKNHKPGDEVKLKIKRDDKEMEVKIILAKRP